MKRKSFETMRCPAARALEHVGDGWNILILRDAFYGLSRFDEFQKSLGIAPNILTRRLNDLVESGLLERRAYTDKPPRHEYVLTPMGRDFRPVLLTLVAWGSKHFAPTEGPGIALTDDASGEPVDLIVADARTGLPLSPLTHSIHTTASADETAHWRMEAGRERRLAYSATLVAATDSSPEGHP